MYSSVHGSVGVVIVGVTYLITKDNTTSILVGGSLSFLAHDPTDRLGEEGFKSVKLMLFHELPCYFLMILGGLITDNLFLFLFGYISGNGIDLIDKKLYLSVLYPNKYRETKIFKCHKRNPNIQLTLKQTKIASWISCLLIIIITLIFIK